MRPSPFIKAVVGCLFAFQHSSANDGAPSVAVPGSVNQCGTVPLDIKGGTPPYTITIKKADNPTGAALQSFSDVNKQSSLALPNGMSTGMVITFEVKDSKGQTTHSGQSTVSSSPDCPQPPQENASKTDGVAASKNPADVPAPAPPGAGDPNNSTNAAAAVPNPSDPAGGSPAPAPSAPDLPPNALNDSGGTNSTAPGPESGNSPPSNTTNSSGNVNANMTDKAGTNNSAEPPGSVNSTTIPGSVNSTTMPGMVNSTAMPGSVNSTATTAPRPGNTPPKSNTTTINGNTKSGNNTSSLNNKSPKPTTSESSRRQLNPLYLSLFISSLAGFSIST